MRNFCKSFLGAVLALALAALFAGCPSPGEPSPPPDYHCKGNVFVPFSTEGSSREGTEVPFVCNEIILDPANPKVMAAWRKYLLAHGFEKVDSCACGNEMELWRFHKDNLNDPDFDVIGIVEDPPPDVEAIAGGGPAWASLNYVLSFEPVELKGFSDSLLPEQTITPCPANPVKVAIVDTGIDIEGGLGNTILGNFDWDFTTTGVSCDKSTSLGFNIPQLGTEPIDNHGHGTAVNGVVAGIPYYNDVTLDLPLEFLNIKVTDDSTGSGSLFKALCGLYYAIEEGANVINVSWGYMGNLDNEEIPMIERCLDYAASHKAIVVAGMGNDYTYLNGYSKFLPASLAEFKPNVISVGATQNGGAKANFSNWGFNSAEMTITAPGVEIISAYPKKLQSNPPTGVASQSGTSFSAPHVTRTVAALWSLDSGLSMADVITIIKNTGDDGGSYRKLHHKAAVHQVCPDFPL